MRSVFDPFLGQTQKNEKKILVFIRCNLIGKNSLKEPAFFSHKKATKKNDLPLKEEQQAAIIQVFVRTHWLAAWLLVYLNKFIT